MLLQCTSPLRLFWWRVYQRGQGIRFLNWRSETLQRGQALISYLSTFLQFLWGFNLFSHEVHQQWRVESCVLRPSANANSCCLGLVWFCRWFSSVSALRCSCLGPAGWGQRRVALPIVLGDARNLDCHSHQSSVPPLQGGPTSRKLSFTLCWGVVSQCICVLQFRSDDVAFGSGLLFVIYRFCSIVVFAQACGSWPRVNRYINPSIHLSIHPSPSSLSSSSNA